MSASLPGDDRDGLASLARQLVDDPSQVHVVVALVDCTKITSKVESGDVIPTARIRAIEPIGTHADALEMRRLLRRAYERRTGKVELPLELEYALEEIEQAIADADDERPPEPGEES